MRAPVLALVLFALSATPSTAHAQFSVSIGAVSAVEGDPGQSRVLVFPVTFSGGPAPAGVTLHFRTTAGSATGGADYVEFANGVTQILPGATSWVIAVQVVEDLEIEPDETLEVTLFDPQNAVIDVASATGTIVDDDADNHTLSVGDASVLEGDLPGSSTLVFPLSLSGVPNGNVTVRFTTGAGTATPGEDFTAVASGQVTIVAPATSGSAQVQVVRDGVFEPDETLTLTLSLPANAVIGDGTGTGTILNDDDDVAVSIGDASVVEGNHPSQRKLLRFPITLVGTTAKIVTVRYATTPGSATVGDYLPATDTVIFPGGQTSAFADVTLLQDLDIEPDESFTVTLSDPTNAALGDAVATGTILNDDSESVPALGPAAQLLLGGALLAGAQRLRRSSRT